MEILGGFRRLSLGLSDTPISGYENALDGITVLAPRPEYDLVDNQAPGRKEPITGDTGKTVDDERVAEGPAVAVKRGNARGAKRPCCCARTPTRRKARVNDKNTH
jgi:hypothetical protein